MWTFVDKYGQKRVNSGIAMTAQQLAYGTLINNTSVLVATEAAAQTLITLPSIVSDGSPIIIEFFCPAAYPSAGVLSSIFVSLWEGSTNITRLCQVGNETATSNLVVPLKAQYEFTPTPGVHTYTIKANANTGVWSVLGNVGGVGAYPPIFARITRADWAVYNPGAVPKMTTGPLSAGPPANPQDGDIWIATSVGANGERWQFQYDASWVIDAYKWKFIGGSDVHYANGSNVTVTAQSAWNELLGTQRYTVVRAGYYTLEYSGDFYNSGTTDPAAILTPNKNGIGDNYAGSTDWTWITITNGQRMLVSRKWQSGQPWGVADIIGVALDPQVGSFNTSVKNSRMFIRPVRIS